MGRSLFAPCPSGVRRDLRGAKKDQPKILELTTRYLATLHLTYVRAIIYNPTFHKKT